MGRGGRKNRGNRKRRRTEEESETNDGGTVKTETCIFDDPEQTDKGVLEECPLPSEDGPWMAAWRRIARKNWPKETMCREPTCVQSRVWPILCSNMQTTTKNSVPPKQWNLICLSPTGTGKTLAYGLPLLLSPQPGKSSLILLPTRELVQQVGRELLRASKVLLPPTEDNSKKIGTRVSVQTIYGGIERKDQLDTLQSNLRQPQTHNIVVATSGRLVDLVSLAEAEKKNDKSILESVQTVVLDEADQLAINRDLEAQIESIFITQLRPPFRICLFSATWPEKVTPKWRGWIRRGSFSIQPPRPCAVVKVNTVDLIELTKNNHKVKDEQEESKTKHAVTEESKTKHAVTEESKTKHAVTEESKTKHAVTEESKTKHAVTNPESEEKKPEEDVNEEKDERQDQASPSSNAKTVKHHWSEIPSNITQTLHVCADHKKPRKLLSTLQQLITSKKEQKQRQVALGIVFFAKIKTIQYTSKLLQKEGISSAELHSQMNQPSRERSVFNFKSGKIPLLLATDIAARGLHVSGIRFVINYDFPGNLEHYVHRCGRAGRDGNPATVYSFFTRNLAPLASDMVHLLQTCKQWLDPNLVALKEEDDNRATKKDGPLPKKSKESVSSSRKKARIEPSLSDGSNDLHNDDEDGFPSLALDRIVLKRALHVSDASDSDEENDDDHED